jgi:hypothetical protein
MLDRLHDYSMVPGVETYTNVIRACAAERADPRAGRDRAVKIFRAMEADGVKPDLQVLDHVTTLLMDQLTKPYGKVPPMCLELATLWQTRVM